MKENIRKIVMVILVLIAVGCAGYLVWYNINASKADESYEKAKEQAVKKPEPEAEPVEEEPAAPEIPIDFAALQATNPDVYAWIKIEGTNVDYPIVQSQEDNLYYLNHTWDKMEASQGAIFTQSYNHKDFKDYNTVIYGHRMGNGNTSMFHDTHNYMDPEYLKAHQDIIIYTPEHKFTYKVFAAVVYDDRLILDSYNFLVKEQRQAFLDSIYAATDLRSQFADNVEVTADDKVITLSTCLESEPNHRFLVEAVLISEE